MIYVASCCGRSHSRSEDAVLVGTEVLTDTRAVLPFPQSGAICVADGVGGNLGGAQASQFMCRALAEAQLHSPQALEEYLRLQNGALLRLADADPALSGMATTMSGIYITEAATWLFHVGNTRVYTRQGKYLKQLTSDHTVYQWLMSMGDREAARSCNKNEITNCFGGGDPALLSKLTVTGLGELSCILLTSDGVHEYVDIDTLEAVVNSDLPGQEKCSRIVQLAEDAGSCDDRTVILAYRD